MKHIKYIKLALLGVMVLLTLNSCDDYLTDAAKPIDKPGGDDFYDTKLKVNSGIVGIYEKLYDLYEHSPDGLMAVYENRSDNGQQQPGNTTNRNNFTTKVGDAPSKTWNDNYSLISRANIMIQSIPRGFPDYESDEELARLIGEARFMRAFSYFHLVTIFGAVPMITSQLRNTAEAKDVTRNPVQQIFDELIIPDLEFAAAHCFSRSQLEELNQLGHAPAAAAKVLLAEAYLNRDRFSDAEKVAKEVINSGEYTLVQPYSALYGDGADNNPESIFEIQYNYAESGRATAYSRMLPFAHQGIFTFTTSVSVPTDSLLYNMVKTNDTRYSTTLDSGLYSLPNQQDKFVRANLWKKYMDFSLTNPAGGATVIDDDWNIQLFRLADAYHMAAEAQIDQGKVAEAFALLNVVRERANMPDYDPAGISQDKAMDMYLHERRMEFAGEMKRWRDLKRTNKAQQVIEAYLGTPISADQLIYPIPLGEINANPEGITQNPGY